MGKKLISILLTVIMIVCLIPGSVFASQIDIPGDIEGTVYISYSHDGRFAEGDTGSGYMAYIPVDLEDLVEYMDDDECFYDPDHNGENDVVLYWLFKYCLEHYDPYGTDDWYIQDLGSGSAYMKTGTWHKDDGTPWDENLNYYANGMYPLGSVGWGATLDQITLHDGDFIDVMHYTDWFFHTDENAGFQYFAGTKFINDYNAGQVSDASIDGAPGYVVHEFSGTAGRPISAALIKSYGSESMNFTTGYAPFENVVHYGSAIYEEDGTWTTDSDGMFSITFAQPGDYWIWTDGTNGSHNLPVNAPAVAKVHIDPAPPENHAPVLAAGVEAFAFNSISLGEAYVLDLDTMFTDPDGDVLTYTVSIDNAAGVPANAKYRFFPDDTRYYSLEFRASDGQSESTDSLFVMLEVTPALGTDPTVIYKDGVNGSGWTTPEDASVLFRITVDNVKLSGARTLECAWDGNDCEVLLNSITAQDASITLTTEIADANLPDYYYYMKYNGESVNGRISTWTASLVNGETTVTLIPFCYDQVCSGDAKTVHIKVKEKDHGALTGLEITTPPAKITYYPGQTFRPDGMVVTASYEDGTSETVDHGKLTFTPETIQAGTSGITIGYKGMTVVQPITVVSLPAYVGIVDYILDSGSVDTVEIQDANGNGLNKVANVAVDGTDITVALDRSIAGSAQVKAVFTLTQNAAGYPFLSSRNSTQAANYKTNTFATTLSNGTGTAKAYLYNHNPSSSGRSDATLLITYKLKNDLPVLAAGVPSSASASIVAGNSYTLDLAPLFTDADGDALTYRVSVNGADAVEAAAGYSFTTDQMGTYELVFRAYDGYDLSDESYTVELTVERSPGTWYVTNTSGLGYSTEAAAGSYSPVSDGGSYTVKLNIAAGYIRSEFFAVMANGVPLAEDSEGSGLFTISNIHEDKVITVSGIQDDKPYIIAPAGSTITLGGGPGLSYFKFDWIDPVQVETLPDGRVKNTYDVTEHPYLFYRVQNPDGITYWNYFTENANIQRLTLGTKIEVTPEDIHLNDPKFNKNTIYHNFEYNNLDLADIYLNINAQGYLPLSSGETKELDCFRNWFAIESYTNKMVAVPDFHYEVMDVNGAPSDLVTIEPDAYNSGLATLTAGSRPGTAIVKVTYDAMIYMQAYAEGDFTGNWGAGGEDPTRFSHIWPETSGIFVVTVDAPDAAGIDMGMTINTDGPLQHAGKVAGDCIDAEHDLLYYLGDEGASYTFAPESGTTVSIARGTVTPTGLTYNGFTTEGIITDGEGNVTVTGLTDGRHIVRVEKNGAANYQILTARKIKLTLKDEDGFIRDLDYKWNPGDKITVTLSEVDSPQEKLSGYYNASFAIFYEDEAGVRLSDGVGHGMGQYDFSYQSHTVTATIPADWSGETFTLSHGAIRLAGFAGEKAGGHRSCSYATGTGMTWGSGALGVLGSLPDLTFKLRSRSTVDCDITIQHDGEFIIAPQSGVEVSSDLANAYGFRDEVTDGVSALDVLVAAHKLVYGDAFTPQNASEYLVVDRGQVRKQFGVDIYEAHSGFFVNHAFPVIDLMNPYGLWAGAYVTQYEVLDDDLVEFMFYAEKNDIDTYNWFTDTDGNYSRTFEAHAGEDLDLILRGYYPIYYGTACHGEAEVASCSEAYDVDAAQLYTVDLATGALTEISGALTSGGHVTLNFAAPGVYTITTLGTVDCRTPQIMSLTTINVAAHNIAYHPAAAATCEEAGCREHWFCSDCGKVFADADGTVVIEASETVIPAHGHVWGKWTSRKDLFNTSKGGKVRYCTVCGAAEELKALDPNAFKKELIQVSPFIRPVLPPIRELKTFTLKVK